MLYINNHTTDKKPINSWSIFNLKCFILFVIFIVVMTTTKAQTFELVKDINPGSDHSLIENITEYNGKLYFAAYDGTHGFEPWVSDGTNAGTTLLKDLNQGADAGLDYLAGNFTGFDGKVYFRGTDGTHGNELWVTDGTVAGTLMLKDINPGSDHSNPYYFTEYDEKLYFPANDGVHGDELWVTDGTSGGTQMVKDINQGGDSNPRALIVYNGELYFTAKDAEHGDELWKTNGSSTGTQLVKDIYEGTEGSYPAQFSVINGKLCFQAENAEYGHELWKTDGTSVGTQMVKDIASTTQHSSYPKYMTAYNGYLYFNAIRVYDDEGFELWRSDGTSSGTQLVKDIYPGFRNSSRPDTFTKYNGKLYFRAFNDLGYELWVTNGTVSGTQLVKDILPGSDSGSPIWFTEFNDKLYFVATESTYGSQLWSTDGSTAGTSVLLPEDVPSLSDAFTHSFTEEKLPVLDEALYFAANYDSSQGVELWKFTAEGMSVEDYDKNNFTIYPNPVEDILNLKIKSDNIQQIELFSITGKCLKSWSEQTEINLSGFAPGNYIIQISTSDDLKTSEQIIKR